MEICFADLDRSNEIVRPYQLQSEGFEKSLSEHRISVFEQEIEPLTSYMSQMHEKWGEVTFIQAGMRKSDLLEWFGHSSNSSAVYNKILTFAYMISIEHPFFKTYQFSQEEQRMFLDGAIEQWLAHRKLDEQIQDIWEIYDVRIAPKFDLSLLEEWEQIQQKLRERVSPTNSPERK